MYDLIRKKHIEINNINRNIIKLLSIYPNLESIHLRNVKGLKTDILEQLSISCPKVKSLIIENADGLHGIDVSKFKNLQFLTIRSNQNLSTIRGLAQLENLIQVEIYDNTVLTNKSKICRDLVKFIKSGAELNLDVLMYPEMQKAISENNNRIQKQIQEGKSPEEIEGTLITEQMQNDVFLWSEMLNKQYGYTHRNEKEEQKASYKNYTMSAIEKLADEIIRTYIEPDDTDEQKFAILYTYLTNNVKYHYASLEKDNVERMKFHIGKTNTNGIAEGFLHGACVCEGYVRMLQYLLGKCHVESQETGCLTEQEAINERKKIYRSFNYKSIFTKRNIFK